MGVTNLKDIRQGNDIRITWSILHDSEPYILTGKNLTIIINRGVYKFPVPVEEFTVDGNKVIFTYYGKDQEMSGVYFLTLIENDQEKRMHTVDSCPAFRLVKNSCEIGGGTGGSRVQIETLELVSTIELGGGANIDVIDNLNSNSTTSALSARQGKVLNEAKQDTLVSGTTIKTINGETLLGSGNILIDGGSGVAGVSSVNGKTGVVTLTKDDLSLGNVDNTSDIDKPVSTEQQMALDGKVDKVVGEGLISNIEKNRLANVDNYDDTELRESITNLDNTKVDKVTGKSLVSDTEITRLASVDNYDDTAIKTRVTNVETKNSEQDTAIAGKQATLVSGTNIKTINNESLLGEGNITIEGGTTAGVTSVNTRTGAVTLTAEDVNLGNVDNTSDADKPVSTATQTALDDKVDKVTNKGLSTNDYTTEEKTKLAGIEDGAQVNDVISVDGKTGIVTLNDLYAPIVHNHDASAITSGVLDIARIPHGALERCVIVADDNARFALTTDDVQKGDTVKITSTNKMYFVVDDTKLNVEDGYIPYSASASWENIEGKPTKLSDFTDDVVSGKYVPVTRKVNNKALSSDITLDKSDIGLGNVDNTKDVDKPISTATQAVLDLKANTSDIPTIPDIDIPAVTGGNAITDITVDATDKHKINVTKGTFLTDHQDISGKLDTSTYNSDKETQAAKDLEQDNAIAEKQATLVFSGEGQNIKTVGGTNLSGTGNIAVGDANVQSDWDATEGDAFILNKPTIPIIPDITITSGDLVAGEAITSLTPNGHTITATKGTFLTKNAVSSVNAKTGAVVLEKKDIGLGNVDNTSDANKPLSTAAQTAFSGKADKIESIDGTSGAVTITLEPNKLYKLGSCTSIEITLGVEIPNIYNEYMLQFTSSGVTTIGIPNGVKWSEFSDVSAIVANNIYQISIVGNLATIIGGKTE